MRHCSLCIAAVAYAAATTDVVAQCVSATIDHPNEGDAPSSAWWGTVEVSGDTLVVSDAFEDWGVVHVYRRMGTEWQPDTTLYAPVPQRDDDFGSHMSLRGDLLAVAATRRAAPESFRGAVYVFRRHAEEWRFEAELLASDGDFGDYFGHSLCVGEDEVLIGAPSNEIDGLRESGSAYVFRITGGVWTEEARLSAPDPEERDYFGIDVALRNDVAVVGAHVRKRQGTVLVFTREESGWHFTQELVASDGRWGDRFGEALAIGDAKTIAVGAYNDSNENGTQAGVAYVFEARPDETWEQRHRIVAPAGDRFDAFGADVVFGDAGRSLLIGAPYDGAGHLYGSCSVFRRAGDAWALATRIAAPAGRSQFGGGLAADGDLAAIASHRDSGSILAHVLSGVADVDCNENGAPDACDIVDGTSEDANMNGIPDECERQHGDGVVGFR